MTFVTIDTRTKQAQKLVELIATLPFAKILPNPEKDSEGLLEALTWEIPEWQKAEVRQSIKEIKEDPTILVDENVVFDILNKV